MAPSSLLYVPLSLLKKAASQESTHNQQPCARPIERRYAMSLLVVALMCGAIAGTFIA